MFGKAYYRKDSWVLVDLGGLVFGRANLFIYLFIYLFVFIYLFIFVFLGGGGGGHIIGILEYSKCMYVNYKVK